MLYDGGRTSAGFRMGKVAGAAFLDVAGVRNHEAPRDSKTP